MDPSILLCDEPTGDLDRASADQVLGILEQLCAKNGTTIVMVTHDPRASDRASRVLHLDKGVLVEKTGAAHA
jgi:putative ABC transport system ATP-binding protein